MNRSDKPRIEKSRGVWHCRNYLVVAEGDSPVDAYEQFVIRLRVYRMNLSKFGVINAMRDIRHILN